ncbi:SAM-dependent methyltransferase [Echinicola strongylocentroti]|uniref:SAM-dependent methyltransferase n=1 Tax=Echinicola strongylocentroti TaxID=1795355 RepID=A0A2Z4IKC0_9BACT|nr:methyltransferase domain-containing protein [Echinicola strongylocentroti]AWW30813.1 SAM-dependent methyltransferase [Echinicola strongylocentroti]
MINHLKNLLAASNHPQSLGMKFRKARFQFFEDLFLKQFVDQPKVTILDVGGTQQFWKDQSLLDSGKIEVILLNLSEVPISAPHITSKAGDATDLSAYGDKSIDLVFSNSVIEHLYTWENQQKMAAEIRRVGKRHFVQTPNKYFFLEPHYALPFFQYLPKSLGHSILTKTKMSRFRKWGHQEAQQYLDEIRLISEKEMTQLFPNSKMYYEKFGWMNKSFIAHDFVISNS